MKKRHGVFLLPILVVLVIACGTGPAPGGQGAPPWSGDPVPEDVLWGTGSNNANINTRMTMALAAAREDIGLQLAALVQGMVLDYAQNSGKPGSPGSGRFAESISSRITAPDGAVAIQRWEAPDGAWWYLAEFSKAAAVKFVAEIVKSVIDNDEDLYAEFSGLDVQKEMAAQFKKAGPALEPETE